MNKEEQQVKNQFESWVMKISYDFLENPLFQPIGLELSCTNIIIETRSNYSLSNLEESDIAAELYPIAYYRPDTDSIHIFAEHASFLRRETDEEKYAFLVLILFHEASHRLLTHIRRGTGKDSNLWNIAADMEVHNTLYVYNEVMKETPDFYLSPLFHNLKNYISKWVFDKTDSKFSEGLFEQEYLQNIAEEIYNDLLDSKEEETKTFDIKLNDGKGSEESEGGEGEDQNENMGTVKVTVSKYKTKGGKEFSHVNVEFPNADNYEHESKKSEKEEGSMTRKALMENTLQKYAKEASDRRRGSISEECGKFLKKLFAVKIDWKKILRSSLMTSLETSEYFLWAKPRTSLFGLSESIYLPSQCEDEEGYGTVIIARDESGSITDEECAKAASIIMEAKEFYKKIIILKHDVGITLVNEFEDMSEEAKNLLMTRESYGGTSHEAVFKWIAEYDKKNRYDDRISCCLFITDMYSDIEQTQDLIRKEIPRIYLYPKEVEGYVEKDCEKIIGKKIAIS